MVSLKQGREVAMKKRFLKYSLQVIKKYHPEYDDIKMDEMRYGLEGFYLTITKAVIIFTIAILLHIFWEMILMLIFFNVLRKSGFGLHASKSWICLASSTAVFILLPVVAKFIVFPIYIKFILGILAIMLIYRYAPADTIKHPLIHADRRKRYKYITTLHCIILVIILLCVRNEILSNLILFGIYNEIVLILPITYKIFHLSYDNYKNYLKTNETELNIS